MKEAEYSHKQYYIEAGRRNQVVRGPPIYSKEEAAEIAVLLLKEGHDEVAIYQQRVVVTKPRCIQRLRQ